MMLQRIAVPYIETSLKSFAQQPTPTGHNVILLHSLTYRSLLNQEAVKTVEAKQLQ
jgi:hypothetical protein